MNTVMERALAGLPKSLRLWHYSFKLAIIVFLVVVAVLYFWSWLTGVGWLGRLEVARFSVALNQLQPQGEIIVSGDLDGREVRGLKKVVAVTPLWISVRRPNDDNVLVVWLATTKSKLEFARTVRSMRVGDTVLWRS